MTNRRLAEWFKDSDCRQIVEEQNPVDLRYFDEAAKRLTEGLFRRLIRSFREAL
jgi:hypothetical protein